MAAATAAAPIQPKPVAAEEAVIAAVAVVQPKAAGAADPVVAVPEGDSAADVADRQFRFWRRMCPNSQEGT